MRRSVSIKDIARAAGVSYSTVSRALNDNPLISQEVRARIQELARSMGYTPNALAQGLLSRLTYSIGLVITTISDPFVVEVVKGVEEIAQEAGFGVFLATSNNDPDREVRIIETFSRRRVDGVIVASSRLTPEYAGRLDGIHIPVVTINQQAEGEYQNLYSIKVDDTAGGWLGMRHLLDLGHRRIGYIGVENRPGSNARRQRSYLDALHSVGVDPQEGWVRISNLGTEGDQASDIQAGSVLAPEVLACGMTAIFCYCDTVAAGVLLACREQGLSVPWQVSVLGFDDNELCEIVCPPLTTVAQPKRALGQEAMRMLLTNLNGGAVNDAVLQPTLVVRESTGPPPT